jgi:hypothetical protein
MPRTPGIPGTPRIPGIPRMVFREGGGRRVLGTRRPQCGVCPGLSSVFQAQENGAERYVLRTFGLRLRFQHSGLVLLGIPDTGVRVPQHIVFVNNFFCPFRNFVMPRIGVGYIKGEDEPQYIGPMAVFAAFRPIFIESICCVLMRRKHES